MRGPKHAFMVSKPSYDSLAYAIDVAYAVEAMYDCVTVFIPPAPSMSLSSTVSLPFFEV